MYNDGNLCVIKTIIKCLVHSKISCRMAQLFNFFVLFHSVFGVASLLYRLPPAYISSPVSATYKTSKWITSSFKITSKNSPSNEVTLLYKNYYRGNLDKD